MYYLCLSQSQPLPPLAECAPVTLTPSCTAGFKPALEGRAIINLQMSDTFGAYQDISAAISVRATAELLTNRGVIQQFMNERHNAMRDYQRAVRLDPQYYLAYFNAANMYFHMRQFQQVHACVRRRL